MNSEVHKTTNQTKPIIPSPVTVPFKLLRFSRKISQILGSLAIFIPVSTVPQNPII